MPVKSDWGGGDTGKRVSELHQQLIELHKQLRDESKQKWNRSLPFGDELLNRFERAKYLGFGEGTSIYDSSLVIGDVKVGENTWIGPFTVLDGCGGLTIGSFCSVSSGVQIISHDSVKWALSGGKAGYEYAPVEIGDCCYIGGMSLINKGVKIGKHCLIGANSFVNKDIPPCSIVFGTPARVVGEVKEKKTGEMELAYY